MGSAARGEHNSKFSATIPGPGNYEQHKEFGHDAVKVTISGKSKEHISTMSPGPGAYDSKNEVVREKSVSYKMGSSSRTEVVHKEHSERPGPGQYDSPHKVGGGPKYTI